MVNGEKSARSDMNAIAPSVGMPTMSLSALVPGSVTPIHLPRKSGLVGTRPDIDHILPGLSSSSCSVIARRLNCVPSGLKICKQSDALGSEPPGQEVAFCAWADVAPNTDSAARGTAAPRVTILSIECPPILVREAILPQVAKNQNISDGRLY